MAEQDKVLNTPAPETAPKTALVLTLAQYELLRALGVGRQGRIGRKSAPILAGIMTKRGLDFVQTDSDKGVSFSGLGWEVLKASVEAYANADAIRAEKEAAKAALDMF